MKEEDTPLPDLGRGQMEAVRKVVEDELHLSIPIAGLAKDNRHTTHELLYGFPPKVIGMKTDSSLFRLLVEIQNEVHRYAIRFHREKRSRRQVESKLDHIKGIGPKTKQLLLKELKSVKRISETRVEQLRDIVGQQKALLIYAYFHPAEGHQPASEA